MLMPRPVPSPQRAETERKKRSKRRAGQRHRRHRHRETDATKKLCGIGATTTDDFGRKCLLARQLVEAGVRFVEVTHDNWDHHANLNSSLRASAAEVGVPLHGLLA